MGAVSDRRLGLAAGLDTASVVLFVAIGKREHDQDTAAESLLSTAAPFLIALAIAWIALRVWNRPTGLVTGLLVWPITVAVGMVLRKVVWDDGTAAAFVIVATGFLGLTIVGWRLVVALLDRRATRRSVPST